jgi:hypothetical protein
MWAVARSIDPASHFKNILLCSYLVHELLKEFLRKHELLTE